VHTIALGAALVALAMGVWRDYGAFTALKRAGVAYLLAYFLAGGLGLAARAAVVAIGDPEPEPEPAPARGRSRRKKRRAPEPPTGDDPPAADAPETAKDAAAPEPVETG
jgi:hypothetical protein